MQRAFHSPKGLGCWNSYPCGFLAQKKQFRAIRRIPVTVCQASRAGLHDNAPLQSPIHSSSIHCPQQPHPGQPRKQVLPQNLRIPWGHSQMTPATHSVTLTQQPQQYVPPAHTQISDSNLQDYGTAQQCFLSHPVCSTCGRAMGISHTTSGMPTPGAAEPKAPL